MFASKAMGEGIAFAPTLGEVVAPASGTVSVLYPTLHAIGLKLDSGVECIIHIGLNTVELNGEGFTAHVKEGQHVEGNDKLVSFDIDFIRSKGYSLITPLVIVNSSKYTSIMSIPNRDVAYNTNVMLIRKD